MATPTQQTVQITAAITDIDWGMVITIVISVLALGITVYNTTKSNKRDEISEYQRKLEEAVVSLKACSEQLIMCGREKDELRREKFTLLEQIAARAAQPQDG